MTFYIALPFSRHNDTNTN